MAMETRMLRWAMMETRRATHLGISKRTQQRSGTRSSSLRLWCIELDWPIFWKDNGLFQGITPLITTVRQSRHHIFSKIVEHLDIISLFLMISRYMINKFDRIIIVHKSIS